MYRTNASDFMELRKDKPQNQLKMNKIYTSCWLTNAAPLWLQRYSIVVEAKVVIVVC